MAYESEQEEVDIQGKTDEEIIRQAIEWYNEDLDYEMSTRQEQDIDEDFAEGLNQWDPNDVLAREGTSRPTLTINRMSEFLNHVKNENRQNRPSIKVSPSSAEDPEIQKQRIKWAENRQGLIRHIQYDSKAQQAYNCAFDDAVDVGRGWFIIETEYVNNMSFNQKIVINRIPSFRSVVPDRNRKEIDYSDMKRCSLVERVPRKRFQREYPEANQCEWITGAYDKNWVTQDDILVNNFYCVTYTPRTLYGMENGDNYFEDELKDLDEEKAAEIRAAKINEREVNWPHIKCYKMTACEILQEWDIPGDWIPLVPVIGKEKEVKGKLMIKGMVRDLRDSQRLYNFWSSTEAELLSRAPKAPYIVDGRAIEGYEKYWRTANIKAWAYLPYKTRTEGNKPVAPPQRVQPEPPPIGVITAKTGCIEDMRSIVGLHAPSLGLETGQSGRAIIAEQRSGDTATYHFTDHMGIALSHAGRIINSMLNEVYDTERIEKILGEDGEEDVLPLGTEDKEGNLIGLGNGEYSVVVSMGPAYSTRRQAAADAMIQFMKAVPGVVPYVYDLLVKNMDWPGAQEIADRLRKTIPPEILEKEGGEQELALKLKQAIGQIQQYEELIPALAQKLEEAMGKLESNNAEIEKDLEVEKIRATTDIAVANIKANTERRKIHADILKNNTQSKDVT